MAIAAIVACAEPVTSPTAANIPATSGDFDRASAGSHSSREIDPATGSPYSTGNSGSQLRASAVTDNEGFEMVKGATASLVDPGLTFEDLTHSGDDYHPISAHNPYHGVTFSATLWHWNYPYYGQAHSGTIFLFNAFGAANQSITYSSPTVFKGVWASEPHEGDASQLVMTGYNGATLVGTATSPPLTGTTQYVPANFAGPVTKVVFNTHRNTDGDWYVIDDINSDGPSDETPPVVVPTVTGTLGSNDWYTSDVSVTWATSDDESPITSPECSSGSVTDDTIAATFTCSATSLGGTTTTSVTVKRDATNPSIGYTGNAGTYTVDQSVSISCSASDAMSGLDSSTCANVSGSAFSFGVGSHSYSASAFDNAGNTSSAATSFTVVATSGSLCALVRQWVTGPGAAGVANSLCVKLAKGNYAPFINEVQAQSGKKISTEHANILIAWAQTLL